MELSEFEKRRATNLIWNAAEDYGFQPELRAYDANGRAELYWNSVIGAARRDYQWEELAAFFQSFQGLPGQLLYENLLWLGLEHAVYERERLARPAWTALRRAYARRVTAGKPADRQGRLVDILTDAYFRGVLGEAPPLDQRNRQLLEGLAFSPEWSTAEVVRHAETLFREYLDYEPAEEEAVSAGKSRGGLRFLIFGRRRRAGKNRLPTVRGFSFGLGEHAGEYGESAKKHRQGMRLPLPMTTSQTEQGLRTYITNYFGEPLYDQRRAKQLEQRFCTGNHRTCHLHFTRGVYRDTSLAAGYVGAQKREHLKQIAKNQAYYQKNLVKNRISIERLTQELRNSMLTQMEASDVMAATGSLQGGRVWRGTVLNDDHIFKKQLKGSMGSLSVDILLDGSISQRSRQEQVSTQGYIIAESLTRCGLPVRVYSFCSMSGYTVVNLFRDYHEPQKNENIFHYFTTGCNRDGLAIRVAAGLLRETGCEHRMLITLSDAKPNDVLKVADLHGGMKSYTEETAIQDTAEEVHRARMEGISVLCVFTGEDEDLPAVRRIYGREFTRIRSLEQLAEAVGTLIRNQIKSL